MNFTPDEKNKLEKAFDLYVNNARYPSEEELSGVELSAEFQERMKKIINGEKTLKVHNSKKVLQWVASFVVIFVLGVGAFAVGTFAEPNDVKENKTKKIIELHNSAIHDTEKMNRTYTISYLPEGYIRNEPWYYGGSGPWKNEQGDTIDFLERRYYNEYTQEILLPEIDLTADIYEKIDGGLYISNSTTGFSRYIWSAHGYVFEIRTDNCSKEEILKMKNSLRNH